jgi:hypothetical protein
LINNFLQIPVQPSFINHRWRFRWAGVGYIEIVNSEKNIEMKLDYIVSRIEASRYAPYANPNEFKSGADTNVQSFRTQYDGVHFPR